MKAYDLMKLAAENPQKYEGKRYRVVDGLAMKFSSGECDEVSIDCTGTICNGNFRVYVSNLTELEETPQSVSFMEAVKAYSEGNTVECNSVYGERVYKPTGRNSFLTDNKGSAITPDEIMQGKWYIKEESR